LQHEALPSRDDEGKQRVIFAFNIGLGGQGDLKSMEWDKDPVSGFMSTATYPIENYPLVYNSEYRQQEEL
jgi:hypothetical protein